MKRVFAIILPTMIAFCVRAEKPDIIIYPDEKQQPIEGFGACFNELGWEAF